MAGISHPCGRKAFSPSAYSLRKHDAILRSPRHQEKSRIHRAAEKEGVLGNWASGDADSRKLRDMKGAEVVKPRPEWLILLQNAHLVHFFRFGLPEQGQALA